MSWVTIILVVLVFISVGISLAIGKEDVGGGLISLLACSFLSFMIIMLLGTSAHYGKTITYQEEIEVSAITFGDKTEVTYVPVSTVSASGQLSTTVVPSSTSSSYVTYINKETGKVEEFSPEMGTFLIGEENKVIITYSELAKDNPWYEYYGKDKTATDYIVTMIKE